MRANFEFINKLGVDKWCFHDRDIAPDGKTLEETNANLDEVVALAKELQGSKIRPSWGTAQLFVHPHYMHGGATSSELGVYAYAAAQVKKAIEARFLETIVAYKKKIGFNGLALRANGFYVLLGVVKFDPKTVSAPGFSKRF
ncbi:hypothetical protein SLEP1_g6647 [Rubroshorea leprosula]|uniref:Xylose isomerase n=2 Tax=Rubroshorea leprosula TaxID=152421 RepID=A0AAV5I3Z5_9ROSI|nr:hypothetical protein SLEP1_g6647 [Rubroshorea leprosula]